MTISAVRATNTAWPTQGQRPHRADHAKMLEPAAKALGLSTDDLETQLQSGKSLADVAQAQGVSEDDLVSSIAADIKANAPQGAPPLSDAQATNIATRMVEHKPGAGRGPGGPPPATFQANLTSLASSLGTDPDTLLQQLRSGDTTDLTQSTPWDAGRGAPTSGLLVDDYA